jgi:hypothetical protein
MPKCKDQGLLKMFAFNVWQASQETHGEVPDLHFRGSLILFTIFPSAVPKEWAELCPHGK